MIPKFAVKRFVERERKDFDHMKEWSTKKLEREFEKLPQQPNIWNKLRKEQKVCFLIGAWERRFAFHLDTGYGKTLLSISLARYFRSAYGIKRFLVLVPSKANVAEWVDEIEKHSPSTSFVVLSGSSESKWKKLSADDATLYITTYSGFVRMSCEQTTITKGKKKGQKKLAINASKVRKLQKLVSGAFLDESTEVQSHRSLAYRLLKRIMFDRERPVFELTGTPMDRNPTALWSQFKLLDDGYTLGETLGLFRAAFFSESENVWGGREYTFLQKKRKLLSRMIRNVSIRYEVDESDLPNCVPIIKTVKLPTDARTYYEEAKKTLRAARGDFTEMKNAFVRMRQISSGFLGYKDDYTGEKCKYRFDSNPKLDALMAFVSATYQAHKIVVFHDFIFSGSLICESLEEKEIGFAKAFGQTKNVHDELSRFKRSDRCRVFVVNQTGAYGLNLQVARYAAFYESPVPFKIRRQMERRVRRQHSDHDTIFQYDFVTLGTFDQRILDHHRDGGDLFRAIVDGKASI